MWQYDERRISRQKAHSPGDCDSFRSTMRTQPFVDLAEVSSNGVLRDVELRRHLSISFPLCYKSEDLHLAPRQRVKVDVGFEVGGCWQSFGKRLKVLLAGAYNHQCEAKAEGEEEEHLQSVICWDQRCPQRPNWQK